MTYRPPRGHQLRPALVPGQRGGEGPLVVLAHGLEDEWRSWGPLVDRLAGHWRCVALDLPWRAGNDYRWRAEGSPGEWLASGLRALGEQPALVIGHSFGANAALEALAHPAPPPTAAAVLAAPFFRVPGTRVTWEVFERSRAQLDAMTLRLPGSVAVYRESYDHFCHVRRAGEVARTIEWFLSTVTAAGIPPTDEARSVTA
jgi:pimeloyl-ACP methyl ester carboxylesterase